MADKDIIIEGININQLHSDLIEQRKKMREGASKVMAENLELAKSLTKQLLVSKDVEEIKRMANEAYAALEIVDMVSYVSNVHYYLPYSSNYDDYSDIMSHVLEEDYYDYYEEDEEDEDTPRYNPLLKGLPEINKLTRLFRDLEYQSGKWNTSFC